MTALDDPREELSLEQFLDRARPKLQSLLARYRIPVQDTEDLLQQALLALVYQWDSIRDPEAWLMGTIRKTCLLYWRQRRRRLYESVDAAMLEWMAAPSPPAQEQHELRQDLDTILARLPERCRTLLILRYRMGLQPAEVAERLGYQPSSIGKITARCLSALTRQMIASGLWKKSRDDEPES